MTGKIHIGSLCLLSPLGDRFDGDIVRIIGDEGDGLFLAEFIFDREKKEEFIEGFFIAEDEFELLSPLELLAMAADQK